MHRQIQHGVGRGDQGDTAPPPPGGAPNLQGLFPETSFVALVPSGGVPERGLESYQPPGSLCALPRVVHNCDPGGR